MATIEVLFCPWSNPVGKTQGLLPVRFPFMKEDSEMTVKLLSLAKLRSHWWQQTHWHKSITSTTHIRMQFGSKNTPHHLVLSETCRFWLWYCKYDSPLNVSWMNLFIRNKIALWAGLNWLIKDSIALIACTVAKEQREEWRKRGKCLSEGSMLTSPRQGDCLSLRVAWTKLSHSHQEAEIQIPCSLKEKLSTCQR